MNLLSEKALEERIKYFENIGWKAKLKDSSKGPEFEITKNGKDFSEFLHKKTGTIGKYIDQLYEGDREAINYVRLVYAHYRKQPNLWKSK